MLFVSYVFSSEINLLSVNVLEYDWNEIGTSLPSIEHVR